NGSERSVADGRPIEMAIDQIIEAVYLSGAAKRHQFDFAAVARLETDGRSSGDVQSHAIGAGAIERQPAIHLKKMAMRSDLHRSIASVGDFDAACRASDVDFDRFRFEKIFTWDHVHPLTIDYRIG